MRVEHFGMANIKFKVIIITLKTTSDNISLTEFRRDAWAV